MGARMFVQMKLLEVKRFSAGPAAEATEKFTDFQKQIEAATKRLVELKSAVTKRKRAALMRAAEARVAEAEGLVEKMKEAASIFADDGQLIELSADEIREASERTSACEKQANTMLMEVRKFVTARQIEAKGKDASVEVSTELIKFQTRLSTAQGEVGKQRKLSTSVEQRIAVKRLLDDSDKKLKEMEEKVEKAMTAIAGFTDTSADMSKEESDKLVKDADVLVREAQISVRTTVRFLEQQSRQGKTKEAIAKLDPRMKECQNKITQANAGIKEQ